MGRSEVQSWGPVAVGPQDRDPDADVRALTVARWHEVRRTCLVATGDPSDAGLQRAAEDACGVGFAALRQDWRRAQELAAPEEVARAAALAALGRDRRVAAMQPGASDGAREGVDLDADRHDGADAGGAAGGDDGATDDERRPRYRMDVLAAARALAPAERAVIALVLVDGLDEHHAAEVLGVRPSSVRRRAERARAALDAVPAPPGCPDPLRVLAEASDAVAPTRDPWARVLPAARAADRFARRRRLLAAGAGAAALLAVGGLVAGPVAEQVAAPSRTAALGQRLESWPLRGPLAGDRAFSDAASELTGATSTSRRLLWAGDVGSARVVLVLDTSLRPGSDLPVVEAWTGPAKAAAARLTRTAAGPVDPAVPVIAVAVDRSGGGGDAAVPVLVVTPDAPRGGVAVDLSASPGYAHDATVQRTYTPLADVDGGAVGQVLPRQERTARVRARLRADGAPLYDGPLQVLPLLSGAVPAASERLAANAARGNQGDLPVEDDQLAGLLRDVAVAHAADPAAVQVLHVWSGATGTRGRALVAVVRTPDGATLQVVQEEQLTSTGPEREVVVSGRPIPTASADQPVLWVSRLAPGRLRMVGVGAARAVYRGQSTLPVALDAHGFGEVRLGPPSFIVPQGYHVVTFYDRFGRILAEPAVPEPGSDQDPTDLHGTV